jgi:metal-responsive CopG/Arc/MetJ family transcriptional regulator
MAKQTISVTIPAELRDKVEKAKNQKRHYNLKGKPSRSKVVEEALKMYFGIDDIEVSQEAEEKQILNDWKTEALRVLDTDQTCNEDVHSALENQNREITSIKHEVMSLKKAVIHVIENR